MSKTEIEAKSEKALKNIFLHLVDLVEKMEACNEIAGRKYRRLLFDLFTVDKELERRGIGWEY